MIRSRCLCALAFVTLIVLEMPRLAHVYAESSANLVFEVVPVEHDVPLGKPVYLKFRLRNTGSENVLVNRRFYLNDTVSLEINGPSGRALAWCGRISQIEVSPGDFVLLAPGAHVDRVVEVSCNARKTAGYAFPELGAYQIKAQYQLSFPKEALAKAAHGAIVVKGPVQADPIQVTIVVSE